LTVVRNQLSTGRKYWASDEEVRQAARTRTFYHYGRSIQRRLVLERLEESFENLELGDLAALPLTVEHIMPQTMSPEWIKMLADSGEQPQEAHQELVHTLGNLTLTAYNPELSNDPFERKQQIFANSHLSLNFNLPNSAVWTRTEIEARAEELASRAILIWPGPVPGLTSGDESFDWSRVHAAIAVIPDGRWTSYRDLAIVGGTAAQPVGNHIANHPNLVKAYRVLTAGGEISEGFHWTDPGDTRDPVEILKSEGVAFLPSGRADPASMIAAEELVNLLDDLDIDDLIQE
jgi:alkylated DNA nucleotide flippase Atl1